MTQAPARPRVPPEFFEELYARDRDPWGFASTDYERDKYRRTLAALGDRRWARALEIGCSIGVFTRLLAVHCDELVGLDVSARALGLARERLAGASNVTLSLATFPEQMPAGPWDLVVCSEVLYYLDADGFAVALARLEASLEGGASVLAVHWRPPTATYPLRGDEVHDQLTERLARWHRFDGRRALYRLDVFGGR
jgi:predicted TPR repeat methyltransferase